MIPDLLVDDAVVQFGQFGFVPTVSRADQIACDALQAVDVRAAAFGAGVQMFGRILVSAIHAAVAVVVHGTIADVVAVHHVYYAHDGFGVVGGVSIYLHIEDVASAGQVVVGSFHFGLVAGTAFVVHRYVVGVGVIFAVGDAGQLAELLAVGTGELAGEAFGRRGQDAVVVLVAVRELVGTVAHVGHDFQTQLLGFGRFAVVSSGEGYQTLGQTDEADAQSALVDDGGYGVVWLQLFTSQP